MKLYIIFISLILILFPSKNKFAGKYIDNFGSQLVLNTDSTFNFTNLVDTGYLWADGKWKVKKDTIYLYVKPIYDTVRMNNKKDTLLLSVNKIPERLVLTEEDIKYWNLLMEQAEKIENKLLYKNNKLYVIDENGKLKTKKEYFWWTHKYYDPWYTKQK